MSKARKATVSKAGRRIFTCQAKRKKNMSALPKSRVRSVYRNGADTRSGTVVKSDIGVCQYAQTITRARHADTD